MARGVEDEGTAPGLSSFAVALTAASEAHEWVRQRAGEFDVQPGWLSILFLRSCPHWHISNFMFR